MEASGLVVTAHEVRSENAVPALDDAADAAYRLQAEGRDAALLPPTLAWAGPVVEVFPGGGKRRVSGLLRSDARPAEAVRSVWASPPAV